MSFISIGFVHSYLISILKFDFIIINENVMLIKERKTSLLSFRLQRTIQNETPVEYE